MLICTYILHSCSSGPIDLDETEKKRVRERETDSGTVTLCVLCI